MVKRTIYITKQEGKNGKTNYNYWKTMNGDEIARQILTELGYSIVEKGLDLFYDILPKEDKRLEKICKLATKGKIDEDTLIKSFSTEIDKINKREVQ